MHTKIHPLTPGPSTPIPVHLLPTQTTLKATWTVEVASHDLMRCQVMLNILPLARIEGLLQQLGLGHH